ncbi:MAG: hypothetical protein E7312_03085 [Clostridiales bacterium]|nr:hypothetical protein [Clostridiales bacterium]
MRKVSKSRVFLWGKEENAGKSRKIRNERKGDFLRISSEIPVKFRLVPVNGNGGTILTGMQFK